MTEETKNEIRKLAENIAFSASEDVFAASQSVVLSEPDTSHNIEELLAYVENLMGKRNEIVYLVMWKGLVATEVLAGFTSEELATDCLNKICVAAPRREEDYHIYKLDLNTFTTVFNIHGGNSTIPQKIGDKS